MKRSWYNIIKVNIIIISKPESPISKLAVGKSENFSTPNERKAGSTSPKYIKSYSRILLAKMFLLIIPNLNDGPSN